jgi:DNA (cytosine-5)-methyltransferase 1
VVREVLNAANYGVPQKRERVFFVGFRSDLGINWSFPKPTHSLDALLFDQRMGGNYWERHGIAGGTNRLPARSQARLSRLTDKPSKQPWVTVRDALIDLPEPTLAGDNSNLANHVFQPGARSYPGHTGSHLDEPAKTLKAGVHGVPGGENMLFNPATGNVRYFSVRESARLQTFPDDFHFHGCWSETMRQLGNAVPVRLAEVVARSVEKALVNDHGAAIDVRLC